MQNLRLHLDGDLPSMKKKTGPLDIPTDFHNANITTNTCRTSFIKENLRLKTKKNWFKHELFLGSKK